MASVGLSPAGRPSMTDRFSREDARWFYDRFGAKQNAQGFYEDAALDALIEHGAFSLAHSVLEIGCGTGRLAARLLADHLPASAVYVGFDISETMAGLARQRLAPWSGRARVQVSGGDFDLAACGGPFDRVVATYVFDLMSVDDIATALAAARRATSKGGLLCACGLTRGTGLLSKATSNLWALVHSLKPSLVGGCRPLVLAELVPAAQWRIAHRQVVVSATVPSEVLVAEAI